jgi:DNA (cytosine-5)-methyltransferase 1
MANSKKGEAQFDLDCAKKVAEFIDVLQPEYFSLENVQAYAKSDSFHIIVQTLYRLNYWVDYQVLNAADFGVPQSRRRLILLARRTTLLASNHGFIPPLPPKEKHIGWYEAIKDLVHDLPDSKLADWQIKALPREIRDHLLVDGQNASPPITIRHKNEPSFTCTANCVEKGVPKAILIENTGARSDRPLQTRQGDEPCWTIRAMGQDGHYHRANALLVHPTEQRSVKPYKYADETCPNHGGENIKALLENAKIKALDIACLARLQSFPDDYKWSGKKSVDGKAIGNSVPPLMAQKIVGAVVKP